MSNRKKQHVYILITYKHKRSNQPRIEGVFASRYAAFESMRRVIVSSAIPLPTIKDFAIIKKSVKGSVVICERTEKANSEIVEVFFS